jgi:hypothetical protein
MNTTPVILVVQSVLELYREPPISPPSGEKNSNVAKKIKSGKKKISTGIK